ncbi:MAG: zinc-binding dehydrogenase [Verrucomicrobiales bacterium]|nr:zinc-binding dehydrogenase [Verrucomicrobiales bacterium]
MVAFAMMMKALQLVAHGSPGRFEWHDVPSPVPGPGDVVVAVKACGLNHLDLWLEEAGLPVKVALPRTPGGEVAGVVESVGAGVTEWKAGDRIAVQSNLYCGECEFCRRGEESICLNSSLLGVQCDGGFAELCLVPGRALVRLPASVDFETSAALTLAGSTAMHMLTDRVTTTAGDWVLVVGGASGVGSAAIQIARGLGARVITTASSPSKRAFCQALGAEVVVDPQNPDWPAEVRRATAKRGVDIVVEHVGGRLLETVFQCLARGGRVVTCGATAGREVTLNLWPMFVKQQSIIGSYGRTRKDLVTTLEWAASKRLHATIDALVPFDRGAEAFARLRERKVNGKLVLVPKV